MSHSTLSPLEIEALIEKRQIFPEMAPTLSQEALEKALEIRKNLESYHDLSLRIYIEGKGCDGFYYGVTFDRVESHDFQFPCGPLDIIVDPKSLRFIFGSHVTWVDDERGKGFLVNNPHHERFRGKFYKKKAWQEALTS